MRLLLLITLFLEACIQAPQPKKQPSVYIYNLLEQKSRQTAQKPEEQPIGQQTPANGNN